MNEKFLFSFRRRQQAILNGVTGISQNSTRKSHERDCGGAGISKGLLFQLPHKKELYLFLWEKWRRDNHWNT